VHLGYALQQTNPGGDAPAGRADLAWTATGPAFALRLATTLAGRPPREWLSVGAFDAAGLAPRRLSQRDGGRETRAVVFERAGARVQLAGAGSSVVAAGAQDRWSWLVQLAAIAQADPRQLGVAHLQVAGLRGGLDRWTFRAEPGVAPPAAALDGVPAVSRAAPLLHLVREPELPYDLRIEVWLSPAIHHLPIALHLATPSGRWSFDLRLESVDAEPGAAP
jgi:hypothetical protein